MRREQPQGRPRFSTLCVTLALFCTWPATSGRAADLEAGAGVTLADMASEAQYQAARSLSPADEPAPLETFGAKGGVVDMAVSARPAAPEHQDGVSDVVPAEAENPAVLAEAANPGSGAPESYLDRLTRIVVDIKDDLQTAVRANPVEQDDVAGAALGQAPKDGVPVIAEAEVADGPRAQVASVPDELIFRLFARSATGAVAGGELMSPGDLSEASVSAATDSEAPEIWAPVGGDTAPDGPVTVGAVQDSADAPPPAEWRLYDLVEATGSLAAPEGGSNGQQAAPPATDSQRLVFQATGLTLADMASDMAMAPTPAPTKQAAAPLARRAEPPRSRSGVLSLARFALPPAIQRTRLATRAPVFDLPRAAVGRSWPKAKQHRVLRFPDPRDLEAGRADNALQYPASASLSQFLDGIEIRLPVSQGQGPSRRGRSIMPVSLDQVARRVDWSRAASAATESAASNRGFTFSSEAFAGNHLTAGSYGGLSRDERRQAIMDELRGVFAPTR